MRAANGRPGRAFAVGLGLLLGFSLRLPAQPPAFGGHDFRRADSVAARYPGHSLADLKSLSDKLTQPFSADVDKFRAIYRWVCDNIQNDFELYARNKAGRERRRDDPRALAGWNQQLNPQFFQKLLRERKTVCTGYAYLVKELAFHAGLACRIVDGYGRTAGANVGGPGIPNHSWNAVQLDGQWHLCDATWSSGVVDPTQRKFIQQFSDAYFLPPPALFARNHYPLDTACLLMADKPTLREFLHGPLVYRSLIKRRVLPAAPGTFRVEATKGKACTFRLGGDCPDAASVALRIVRGTTTTTAHPTPYRDGNGWTRIDYVFTRTGTFTVHLLLDEEYALTYLVRVSK
ncbi:MAG: hypothetical protein AVDCRST_MAG56-1724 [uncultured Cytophagales bacterium]|uniref:Transglutaminase-like domain-containing protein n=1 Tax=uncultured Cytophagales bacterium TaxID=158755 RepID=A0A6J4IBP0_9SPHI|nr:MAG: hypothetical protein AVDCRST_MAG56-1724 [uncultured Cytophagales bacterium]